MNYWSSLQSFRCCWHCSYRRYNKLGKLPTESVVITTSSRWAWLFIIITTRFIHFPSVVLSNLGCSAQVSFRRRVRRSSWDCCRILTRVRFTTVSVSRLQGAGDLSLGPNGPTVKDVRVSPFRCPSSTLAEVYPVFKFPALMPSYTGISGAAPSNPAIIDFPETRLRNFAACSGVVGQMSWGGVLVANQIVSMHQITDGASNTMVIAESSAPVIDSTGQRVRMDAGYPASWLRSTDSGGIATSYQNTSSKVPTRCFNLTTVRHPVGMRTAPVNGSSCQTSYPNRPLNSEHTGGAGALLCDGSVRFLSNSMDVHLLKCLATRDDDCQVGEF